MKKLRKVISTLLALAISGVALAGCAGTAASSSGAEASAAAPVQASESTSAAASAAEATPEGKELVYGYSLFDYANPYFINVTKGMQEKCDENGIKLIINDAKSDVAAQVSALEGFIAQKVDMIIVSPLDVVALEPVVEAAIQANIPVVNLNQEIVGRSAHIGMSEYEFGFEGGKIAGQWIKDNLTGPAKVAVLGYPDLASLVERADGLKEGMLSIAPDAVIVNEQKAGTPEQGMGVAETILQATPDVNVLICINDAGALGAYEAFAAAGKSEEKICIVGLDATDEALSKIKEGGMYVGTVDINGYGTGILAVETAMKVLADGPIEEMVEIDCNPVTMENIDEYLK